MQPAIDHQVRQALLSGVKLLSGSDEARHYVLRHGQQYVAAVLPAGIRKRKPGTCFEAAASAVLNGREGLSYVEGFAIGPFSPAPVRHAWLTKNGEAFDRTWPHSLDSHYFGVKFSNAVLISAILARRYYGLLDPIDEIVFDPLRH